MNMGKAFKLCGLKVASFTLKPSLGFKIRPSESNPYNLVVEQEGLDNVQMIVLSPYEAQQLAHQLLALIKKANEEEE